MRVWHYMTGIIGICRVAIALPGGSLVALHSVYAVPNRLTIERSIGDIIVAACNELGMAGQSLNVLLAC